MGNDREYTHGQVLQAVNAAADSIEQALAQAGHDVAGRRDLLNLVVNATMGFLEDPDVDLATVADRCYGEPEQEVLSWIVEG